MSRVRFGKTGVPGKAHFIFDRIKGSKEVINMLLSLKRFSEDEVAVQRMKMIKFYEAYGEKATKEAFGADRKVISRWRQRLASQGGRLMALIPSSTRPHQTRVPKTDSRIIAWIKQEREAHPRVGKEKLKPDLDKFCQSIGIPSVSTSTIGNIIKRHHFFYQKQNYRVYHDPNSAWARKAVKKKKRLRIKHSPRPAEYSHILSLMRWKGSPMASKTTL